MNPDRLRAGTALAGALLGVATAGAADPPRTPQAVFERRIAPIFRSPKPSSCVQCHLAGVDLKHYLFPSHEKTFRSLRDQGLIDLDHPEKSRILTLIAMREKENPGANLIYETTRRAEYDAFAAWIRASCRDPRLRTAPPLRAAERAVPKRPLAVIRHARADRLLDSFEQNVWSLRFRCMSCHIQGTTDNAKWVAQYGSRVAWIKPTAAETMRYLLRAPGLIDTARPENSLLLRKPLGAVPHGGGKKFLSGDLGYQGFLAWLLDYAAVSRDRYARPADLPPPDRSARRFGSDIWLKLENTPPAWGDKLLQVRLFAWDERRQAWEKDPIALSDRGVWGQGKLWQHNLTLLAAPGAGRTEAWRRKKPALPAGRYRLQVYVDQEDRLAREGKGALNENDFVGEVEIQSDWNEGYGAMTVVDARPIRKSSDP